MIASSTATPKNSLTMTVHPVITCDVLMIVIEYFNSIKLIIMCIWVRLQYKNYCVFKKFLCYTGISSFVWEDTLEGKSENKKIA